MVVKKDLQLIVCPCVFEPWALLLLWVSTKSSSTVSSQSTKNPFFHHAVRRRPFLCFSQSLPFFLCVLKFFLLVSFPIICSLALPRSPSLPYFFSSLSTSSSPSSSTEQLLGPITLQEHSNLLHTCQRQTLLLKNSTGSVSALFCSFKGMIGYFWETRI